MASDLQLHHKTYESLGHERMEDLDLLCSACHHDADQNRARESANRSSAALYQAQLDGWATKRYGEDWDSLGDPWQIESEFQDWLDRNEP